MAACQSTFLLSLMASSRASSLPQGYMYQFDVFAICCSDARQISRVVS